jgi:Fe-S cluster assembly ATP-binding protein
MLKIENLNTKYENTGLILEKLNLNVLPGEIHIIMGKNGSGKSTLLKSISGDPDVIVEGNINFKNKDLSSLAVNEIANEGIFMSFQSPVVIEGVNNIQFIKQAVEAKLNYHKKGNIDISEFMSKIKSIMSDLGFDNSFLNRNLNEGFSGGEKKKNEVLQLLMLEPELILLDEIDSGVDIDSIKIIAKLLNSYCKEENKSIIMVTHYEKMIELLKPDRVHIINNKTISKSGDFSLIKLIHEKGFDNVN